MNHDFFHSVTVTTDDVSGFELYLPIVCRLDPQGKPSGETLAFKETCFEDVV